MYNRTGILVGSVLWCICSAMTHVRQSVVGVVIFRHFFLHDPANAEKRAQFGQY